MICAPHRTRSAPRRLPAPPFQPPAHSSPGAGSEAEPGGTTPPSGLSHPLRPAPILMDKHVSLWEWIGAVPLGLEGWGFIRSNLYPLSTFPRAS